VFAALALFHCQFTSLASLYESQPFVFRDVNPFPAIPCLDAYPAFVDAIHAISQHKGKSSFLRYFAILVKFVLAVICRLAGLRTSLPHFGRMTGRRLR
jgi:hypothetical protein